MRLDNFDLNLLLALNVLLDEQSVTRAAERMNLTQSAMSAALGRLRLALNDEILVPHGRKMLMTPHARELAPRVTETIQHLRTLVSGATGFDPATSDRRFEIAASDYVATVLIAPLLRALSSEAPSIRINLSLPTSASHAELADGKLDFLLTPEQFLSSDHPRELLFEERHVVVGWNENPALQTKLGEDTYFASSHVSVQISGTATFIDRHMTELSDRRRIAVVTPSFSQVPWLLPGTPHLALMHERLARAFALFLPLKIVSPPFPVPVMREMAQYHSARVEDAGLQWLLRRLIEAAQSDVSKMLRPYPQVMEPARTIQPAIAE